MLLRRILLSTFLLCALVSAQTLPVTGVVTNGTTSKPAAGDDVVLVQLAQGMQELTRTKTDTRGHFTLNVPAQGLHLIRVTHDRANYFQPIQPGTQSVEIEVYTAAAEVEGVSVDADVMRLQTDPAGSGLKVVEHFFVKNDSSPAKTLFSDHPFEFYLPQGAVPEGAASKAPGGMAVQAALVPMGDANHYTIIFPIRPGESEFQVSYKIPYKDSFKFQPRLVRATDTLAIMMPKSMGFKAGTPSPYNPVTEEMGAQTYVARNVQPSQPLDFTVSGTGELPRDTAAGAGAPAEAGATATTGGDPNTDTRPGGGLGVPLDKDADRDPWQKYRWWIIGGVGLALAAIAGVSLSRPAPGASVPTESPSPRGPKAALDILRDEMFALETDRLEGKLSDAQYAELKPAYDAVLRRALERTGQPLGTVQVVPE